MEYVGRLQILVQNNNIGGKMPNFMVLVSLASIFLFNEEEQKCCEIFTGVTEGCIAGSKNQNKFIEIRNMFDL